MEDVPKKSGGELDLSWMTPAWRMREKFRVFLCCVAALVLHTEVFSPVIESILRDGAAKMGETMKDDLIQPVEETTRLVEVDDDKKNDDDDEGEDDVVEVKEPELPQPEPPKIVEQPLGESLEKLQENFRAAIAEDPDYLKKIDHAEMYMLISHLEGKITKEQYESVKAKYREMVAGLEEVKDDVAKLIDGIRKISLALDQVYLEANTMAYMIEDVDGEGERSTCKARNELEVSLFREMRPDLRDRVKIRIYNSGVPHTRTEFFFNGEELKDYFGIDVPEDKLVAVHIESPNQLTAYEVRKGLWFDGTAPLESFLGETPDPYLYLAPAKDQVREMVNIEDGVNLTTINSRLPTSAYSEDVPEDPGAVRVTGVDPEDVRSDVEYAAGEEMGGEGEGFIDPGISTGASQLARSGVKFDDFSDQKMAVLARKIENSYGEERERLEKDFVLSNMLQGVENGGVFEKGLDVSDTSVYLEVLKENEDLLRATFPSAGGVTVPRLSNHREYQDFVEFFENLCEGADCGTHFTLENPPPDLRVEDLEFVSGGHGYFTVVNPPIGYRSQAVTADNKWEMLQINVPGYSGLKAFEGKGGYPAVYRIENDEGEIIEVEWAKFKEIYVEQVVRHIKRTKKFNLRRTRVDLKYELPGDFQRELAKDVLERLEDGFEFKGVSLRFGASVEDIELLKWMIAQFEGKFNQKLQSNFGYSDERVKVDVNIENLGNFLEETHFDGSVIFYIEENDDDEKEFHISFSDNSGRQMKASEVIKLNGVVQTPDGLVIVDMQMGVVGVGNLEIGYRRGDVPFVMENLEREGSYEGVIKDRVEIRGYGVERDIDYSEIGRFMEDLDENIGVGSLRGELYLDTEGADDNLWEALGRIETIGKVEVGVRRGEGEVVNVREIYSENLNNWDANKVGVLEQLKMMARGEGVYAVEFNYHRGKGVIGEDWVESDLQLLFHYR